MNQSITLYVGLDVHKDCIDIVVAEAPHKLARLIYAMLTRGQEYMDQGQDDFEQR